MIAQSNQDILEKAISKAIENGWEGGKHFRWGGDWMGQPPKLEVVAPFGADRPWLKYTTGGVSNESHNYPPELMIFDKRFAKALWGEEGVHGKPLMSNDKGMLIAHLKNWQYHLQQMVIDPNPIEYLGKHLDD